MKLFIFFGLPGAGKTFSAKVAEKYFSYHLYDGDQDLTLEMQKAIQSQSVITDDMRDIFFDNLIESAKVLLSRYEKIIIHQTFIKEKYRKQFLKEIPNAQFILIETQQYLREKRLRNRKEFPIEENYAKKMKGIFEKPHISHKTIKNNFNGEENIRRQLEKILT